MLEFQSTSVLLGSGCRYFPRPKTGSATTGVSEWVCLEDTVSRPHHGDLVHSVQKQDE